MSADPSGSVDPARIRTPDQRLRVFVSSTLTELPAERAAVRAAVTELRLTPVMFELGARPHPPRELYRAYLDQSDVFVGIYAASYGWMGPGQQISGLEDEYLLSGQRPKLIYLKTVESRHPRLEALIARIQSDDHASYKFFDSAAELGELVADDLAVLLTERFTRPIETAGLPTSGGRPESDVEPGRMPGQPHPLIGRNRELEEISGLLSRSAGSLVTLVGPGGIGKTRLAIEVACRLLADPDGVFDGGWFVDLTPVSDPALLLDRIATVFKVHREGTGDLVALIANRLHGRRVLLVVDNVEQVAAAAADLGRLLLACPAMSVLATSRTVLRLRSEQPVPLAPLPVPDAGPPRTATEVDLSAIAEVASVRLFLDRARQARPGFGLTVANVSQVVELCRRLDGIPLALELAAAQLRVLSPRALLDQMTRALDLPARVVDAPLRQRTLRATIDWSFRLLSDDERTLLARLSVFTQGWRLEGAEAVGAIEGDLDVVDLLFALVSQSLVTVDDTDGSEPRFSMLGAIRTYARERLDERGETERIRRQLSSHLRRFVDLAGRGLLGAGNKHWLDQVDRELPQIQSAMADALEHDDAATVVGLAAPLFVYWHTRGLMASQDLISEAAAALPSARTLPADAASLLLWSQGMFRLSQGRNADAEPFLRRLLEDNEAEEADETDEAGQTEEAGQTDKAGQTDEPGPPAAAPSGARLRAYAMAGLGAARADGDPSSAAASLEQAAAVLNDAGDEWGVAFALAVRGQIALTVGDAANAAVFHERALVAATLIDNDFQRAYLSDLLGMDRLAQNDLTGARQSFAAANLIHLRQLDQEGSSYCIDGLGAVALFQQRVEAAACLFGAADQARLVVGVSVWPGLQTLRTTVVGRSRDVLGDHAFDLASRRGASLSLSEALAYALTATEGTN